MLKALPGYSNTPFSCNGEKVEAIVGGGSARRSEREPVEAKVAWRGSALLVGCAEVVAGRRLVGCAGSGVISRAFAKGWRPFAAWPVGVGERGEGVRARSAVGRGVPESEISNALGGHGEKSGVGSVGSVASRASREGEGVHGALGTNLLAVGSKTKWKIRGRAPSSGSG